MSEQTVARAVEKYLVASGKQIAGKAKEAFIAAIAGGNVNAAIAVLFEEGAISGDYSEVREAVREIVAATGSATASAIRMALKQTEWAPQRFAVNFDLLNPRTVQFLRGYEMALIQQIDNNTRAGINAVIRQGLMDGRNPNAVAREVRQLVGLTERQAMAVYNFRKELETFHLRTKAPGWNVGGKISRTPGGLQAYPVDPKTGLPVDNMTRRRLRDFRYDPTLKKAMETGTPIPEKKIDDMVGAYARKYRAFRARTIARTEARRAQQAGAQQMWEQAVDSGAFPGTLVRRYWLTAQDERVRLSHRPIPALNPEGVGVYEEFTTPEGPRLNPPIAPNCRCTVVYRLLEPGMDPASVAPQ